MRGFRSTCALVLAACVLAAAGFTAPTLGASVPTAVETPDSIPVVGFVDDYSVTMVLVPVVVRSRGGVITGLEHDRFALQVGGRPVPIESFEHKSEAPVSLVVLQDLSGSMAQLDRLEASRRALGCLLDQAIAGDEIALASFAGGQALVEVPFTHDLDTVRDAMSRWEPYGTTALHDAISWLPEIAAAGRPGRRAVVLVTDGLDNQSAVAPELAREAVRRYELPVYVLGLRGPRPRIQTEDHGEVDPLHRLAMTTGGRYYDITGVEQVPEVCDAILSEVRNRYVLGFSVASRGESADHPIQVELKRPRRASTLVHRRGYHGTSPMALEAQ